MIINKLFNTLDMRAINLICQGKDEFNKLVQTNKQLTDDNFINVMLEHLKLIEHPIFTLAN